MAKSSIFFIFTLHSRRRPKCCRCPPASTAGNFDQTANPLGKNKLLLAFPSFVMKRGTLCNLDFCCCQSRCHWKWKEGLWGWWRATVSVQLSSSWIQLSQKPVEKHLNIIMPNSSSIWQMRWRRTSKSATSRKLCCDDCSGSDSCGSVSNDCSGKWWREGRLLPPPKPCTH